MGLVLLSSTPYLLTMRIPAADPDKGTPRRALRAALRTSLGYLFLAGAYILFSDGFVARMGLSTTELEFVQTHKGMAFVAVTSALLFFTLHRQVRSLCEKEHELRQTEREIVEHLGLAAEYRDDETGHHVRRVQLYCVAIARELGWDRERVERLEYAAAMHDIGKIGIPDAILLKKGPLTEEERGIIQRHTEIGGRILAAGVSQLVEMACSIALTHHERWDGTGYPHRLRGEAIPIEGRICAIADVFDALTSRRRYKDAWTLDQAVEEIVSQAGRQFDPHVVAAFSRALPDIRLIREAHGDIDLEDEGVTRTRQAA